MSRELKPRRFQTCLSDHRRRFRIGDMAVDVLMMAVRGCDVEMVIDEPIDVSQLVAVERWYRETGATNFKTIDPA